WNTATVFEDFVFAVCRASMFQSGGTTTKSGYVLATPVPGLQRKLQSPIPTAPDVVVSRGTWTGLLDAKYKTLKKHPKTSDVYQVMAGGRLLGISAVGLVYPAWRSFQQPRSWRLHGHGEPRHLHALPLNLT